MHFDFDWKTKQNESTKNTNNFPKKTRTRNNLVDCISNFFIFSDIYKISFRIAGQQYCAKKVSCNYNDGLLHKKGAKCVSWDQRHCI